MPNLIVLLFQVMVARLQGHVCRASESNDISFITSGVVSKKGEWGGGGGGGIELAVSFAPEPPTHPPFAATGSARLESKKRREGGCSTRAVVSGSLRSNSGPAHIAVTHDHGACVSWTRRM